jgi:hypothetical protein
MFSKKVANETVEKTLSRKMFKKNSHNRLKNRQNVVQNAQKPGAFQWFSPTSTPCVFERGLFRQFQRLALLECPCLGRGEGVSWG